MLLHCDVQDRLRVEASAMRLVHSLLSKDDDQESSSLVPRVLHTDFDRSLLVTQYMQPPHNKVGVVLELIVRCYHNQFTIVRSSSHSC